MVDKELFIFITYVSHNAEISQHLILAVLDFYHGHNIALPLALGEIETPTVNNFKTDN